MTCFCHNLYQNIKKNVFHVAVDMWNLHLNVIESSGRFLFLTGEIFSFDKDNRSDETHFLDCFALLDPIIAL